MSGSNPRFEETGGSLNRTGQSTGMLGMSLPAGQKLPQVTVAKQGDNSKNPLAWVGDLLDEEKEGSQYFGSVVFWKHFEHMDILNIYNPKSLEYRNIKLMVYEFMFYLIWLAVLTAFIALSMGADSMSIPLLLHLAAGVTDDVRFCHCDVS